MIMQKTEFVGRDSELEQFKKVLEDPQGEAVLVVGQVGMGKTLLVNRMGWLAENLADLKCGYVRYEVTRTDSVDSIMALMMDNAFEAAQVKEGTFDGTSRRLEQWRAFLNVFNMGDLAMSLRQEREQNIRDHFLEQLRRISKHMPEEGRAIFIIDPEKYVQADSDQAWAIILRELPEKIKFVFAQRTDGVLINSAQIRGLKNVVRIPNQELGVLEEEAIGKLLDDRSKRVQYSITELRGAIERYKRHPYAIVAALDLIEDGVRTEELPADPTPERIVEEQYKRAFVKSSDAVRLLESYAFLGAEISDEVIEEASGVDSACIKSLMADRYISGLFREESGGNRIYHVILIDYILSKARKADRVGYIERATRAVFDNNAMGFFEKARFIDFLLNSGILSQVIANELHKCFDKDGSLACYFYEKNEYKDVPDSKWIVFLRDAGEFEQLGEVGDGDPNAWTKAKYIEQAATDVPGDVFSIISKIKPQNPLIQNVFVQTIGSMPDKWIEKGSPIIKGFLDKREYLIWYWIGESSAKVMERLLDVNPDLAYEIAGLLLDIWEPEDAGKAYSLEHVRAKFTTDEYNDLVFDYYKKIWEKEPYRAVRLLVDIFDRCLNELNKRDGYDVSGHFYITIKNLDQPDRLERDLEAILVKAICQAGRKITGRQEEKVEPFLEQLRNLNKAIFKRIEMYLLRFVKGKKYSERINEIIADYDCFDNPGFKYEYNLLLKEKIGVVTKETKAKYIEWIENIKVDDLDDFAEWFKRTRKKEYNKIDLEKYESSMRARKLFLVKDLDEFSELYKKCQEISGYSDDDLEPSPVGQVRSISGSEGSPKTREELLEMSVEEVFRFISNPENYKEHEDGAYRANSAASALAYTFQQVIKENPVEYINVENNEVVELPERFLSKYFYGIWDALREKKVEGFPWEKLISVAKSVVLKHEQKSEYSNVFEPMVHCIQEGFKEQNKIEYSEEVLDAIYEAVKSLFEIKEEKDESFERDPIQIRCNSFTGNALSICLSLGIICRRDFPEKFEANFREKLRSIFNKVLKDIKTSWTCCTFGSDFDRIYWLDAGWVESNIDDILSDELWNVIWGTYLKWGQASRELFIFLAREGVYTKAIERIGTSEIKDKDSREDPDNKLANHIVIAHFNGWLEEDQGLLLERFLEKASDKLHGHAARFFTTGFKSLKEEEQENEMTVQRLRNFWESRLEILSKNPEAHLEEGMALACWVINSPFSSTETLKLAGRTLEITKGKLDRNRDVYNFINSVCDLSKGNEFNAITCIRKVLCNKDLAIHLRFYDDKLTELLNAIEKDKHASCELLGATVELVDELGRLRIYKYRGIHDTLLKRLKAAKG